MTTPAPSLKDARSWLEYLYPESTSGWLTLFAIDRTTGEKHTEWAQVTDAERLATRAVELAATCCVWFGVATRSERLGAKRGGADHCDMVPALWLDVDIADEVHASDDLPADEAEARTIIDRFGLAPTAVVHSGHGLQAWWVLDTPAPAAEVAPLLARWNATWDRLAGDRHIDNVFDLPRIMRLPGTLNNKGEPAPVRVTVEGTDWDRTWTLADIAAELDELAPEPERPQRQTSAVGLPGEVYNARHDCHEVLQRLGFTRSHATDGEVHYTRPGKDVRSGSSATVYAEDGHATIWSDSVVAMWPALEVRRPYDPFGLHTCTAHGGDFRAAAEELERIGYGTIPRPDDDTDTDELLSGLRGAKGATAPEDLPVLPSDFWDATEPLAAIRDGAAAWLCSPDAVLAAVLARVVAFSNHGLHIPPTLGPPTPLCLIAAMAGPSGVGKTKAERLANRLVPATDPECDNMPLGSGEGLIESMFELRNETEDGKRVARKVQIRHNAFVYADEGKVLGELAGRQGSTLTSTLRSIFSGATIGQTNASRETHRRLDAGTYTFGVLIGIQPRVAIDLFSDTEVAAGTTQRFLWACAQHPRIGEDEGADPQWRWEPLPKLFGLADSYPIGTPEDVFAEVRARIIARARGEAEAGDLDSHRDLLRLKVMGALALLHGRQDADLDDWKRAGVILDTSDAVRAWVQSGISGARAAERLRHTARAAAQEEHLEAERVRRAMEAAVRSVVARCHRDPGVVVTRRELTQCIAGRNRRIVSVDEVVDAAVLAGQIRAVDGGWMVPE